MRKMMNNKLLILFVLGFLASSICGQEKSEITKKTITQKNNDLVLTMELADTLYCKEYEESPRAMLTLILKYENMGSENIILSRQPFYPYEESVFGVDDSGKIIKKFYGKRMEYFSSKQYYGIKESADEKWFVIIKPSQAYVVNNYLVEVELASNYKKKGLKIGKYAIVLPLRSFPYYEDLAKLLKPKWSSYGNLWSEPLVSTPMKFEIINPSFEDKIKCNDLPTNDRLLGELN